MQNVELLCEPDYRDSVHRQHIGVKISVFKVDDHADLLMCIVLMCFQDEDE